MLSILPIVLNFYNKNELMLTSPFVILYGCNDSFLCLNDMYFFVFIYNGTFVKS